MADRESHRLIAWHRELALAHDRLRRALVAARESLDADTDVTTTIDPLLYCYGFCVALDGHHRGEDAALFPVLAERSPEIRPVLAKLEQDHAMIGTLLAQLDRALKSDESTDRIRQHLDGLSAIMESHFRFEERELTEILSALDLETDRHTVLGPL